MSKLVKQIDAFIFEFCDVIANKYKLNKNDLFAIWKEENESDEKESSSTSPSKVEKKKSHGKNKKNKIIQNEEDVIIVEEKIIKQEEVEKINIATKDMLVAYCKAKGIKQSGKKEEVVKRLLDFLEKDEKCVKEVSKPTISKTSSTPSPILKSISEKSEKIEVRKNKFGNMEHFETGLVFDKDSSFVVGVQNTNGKIDSLTDKTIELCKKFKFKYNLPENLSVDKGLNSVKVEELDEEDEEELDEEDIEEEEEDLDNEVDLEDD